MTRALIRSDARVLVLSSGMVGHEVNCAGVAEALGLPYKKILVAPRGVFRALAPYGPLDPKDRPKRTGSVLAPPFPDIAIASGRVTVPYIRALKKAGGGKVFAVFLQDPRYARREFDLLWAPRHDGLSGTNVIATLTSPPLSERDLRPPIRRGRLSGTGSGKIPMRRCWRKRMRFSSPATAST
jgi:mitochondrial fission protein ELM1